MTVFSASHVLETIKKDLDKKHITQIHAAKLLGYRSRQAISNMLNSGKYLSAAQARRYVKTFGYDYDFLTQGKGELYPGGVHDSPKSRIVTPQMVFLLKPFPDEDSFELSFLAFLDSVLAAYGEDNVRKFLSIVVRFLPVYVEDFDSFLKGLRRRSHLLHTTQPDSDSAAEYYNSEEYRTELETYKKHLLKQLYDIYSSWDNV